MAEIVRDNAPRDIVKWVNLTAKDQSLSAAA
jgi:hypothetical protein